MVTGPGMDAAARQLAIKAGFVRDAEQAAMVLPPNTDGRAAENAAGNVLRMLYFAAYDVTLDVTLPTVRAPVPTPNLSAAALALIDAEAILRVSPHPRDAGALIGVVTSRPMAALTDFVHTALSRAEVIADPGAARDVKQLLNSAAERLAAAEAELTAVAGIMRDHGDPNLPASKNTLAAAPPQPIPPQRPPHR